MCSVAAFGGLVRFTRVLIALALVAVPQLPRRRRWSPLFPCRAHRPMHPSDTRCRTSPLVSQRARKLSSSLVPAFHVHAAYLSVNSLSSSEIRHSPLTLQNCFNRISALRMVCITWLNSNTPTLSLKDAIFSMPPYFVMRHPPLSSTLLSQN